MYVSIVQTSKHLILAIYLGLPAFNSTKQSNDTLNSPDMSKLHKKSWPLDTPLGYLRVLFFYISKNGNTLEYDNW